MAKIGVETSGRSVGVGPELENTDLAQTARLTHLAKQ